MIIIFVLAPLSLAEENEGNEVMPEGKYEYSDFEPSDRCLSCHKTLYHQYEASAMARSRWASVMRATNRNTGSPIGSGSSPLEAMACGTPVVCSNRSSLPEVVGEAGLLFNPDDELDFREKLARLASREDLRQRLQESGRARAAQFTWSRTAEATLRLYRQLAE